MRMGSADVRASNISAVLHEIARQPIAPSRADLAHSTGLTRATVSRLVDDLLHAGILTELETPSTGGPGRPATPVAMRPGGVIALGLEVNVFHLAAVALDLSGKVLAQDVQAGDFLASEPEPVLTRLGRMAAEMLGRLRAPTTRYVGAALALPGLVSDGRLLRAPNLGWRNLDPRPLLDPTGQLGAVRLGNEATIASWSVARLRPGVAAGPENFIYVSGEVGIGGGIVLDSRPVEGNHGWAGEIGHVCVDPNGPRCSCGARGCLEAYAGHRALASGARLPAMTPAAEILAAAQGASTAARQTLDGAAAALGRAVAAVVNVLDVSDVVLGGDLATLFPALDAGMRRELDEHVLARPWETVTCSAAQISRMAASRGGALSVLDRVMEDPARLLPV
jgi:predicted NBD/HSP70 family sugar kinase